LVFWKYDLVCIACFVGVVVAVRWVQLVAHLTASKVVNFIFFWIKCVYEEEQETYAKNGEIEIC